jgi:hypothetical protein
VPPSTSLPPQGRGLVCPARGHRGNMSAAASRTDRTSPRRSSALLQRARFGHSLTRPPCRHSGRAGTSACKARGRMRNSGRRVGGRAGRLSCASPRGWPHRSTAPCETSGRPRPAHFPFPGTIPVVLAFWCNTRALCLGPAPPLAGPPFSAPLEHARFVSRGLTAPLRSSF